LAEIKSASRAVVKALIDHLKASMPNLAAIYDDFPNHNQPLKYPALTVFTGQPKFTNLMPYVHSKKDPTGVTSEVVKIIGQYEFRLQLDVWAKTKFERHDLYEELFRALNPNALNPGLSLKLSEYYDLWCRVTLIGFSFLGSEAESQRNEFRAKVDVIVDVKAATDSVESLMDTIENNLEIPSPVEEIDEPESEDDDSIII
jgi:hypothetical protein